MEYLLSHLDVVQKGVELLLVLWVALKRVDKALLLHLQSTLEPRLASMDEKLDEISNTLRLERKRRRRQHKRIMRLEGRDQH